jgi:LPS O-antigen subunit length determinant protein (WzzB/FepE family)
MQSWEREDTSVWKIAIGVTLGILVAGVIGFLVRAWMAQAAIEQITKQADKMMQQQQQAAQAARDRALAEKAEQERASAYAADARRRAQTAATDAAMRRERAWAKYYKRSPLCDNQPSNETMMKCANEHIRAKRQFDVDYEAGKL